MLSCVLGSLSCARKPMCPDAPHPLFFRPDSLMLAPESCFDVLVSCACCFRVRRCCPSSLFPPFLDLIETKEEREREERILKILEEFKLQGGTYHTHLVMAKSGDRLLGTSSCPPFPVLRLTSLPLLGACDCSEPVLHTSSLHRLVRW